MSMNILKRFFRKQEEKLNDKERIAQKYAEKLPDASSIRTKELIEEIEKKYAPPVSPQSLDEYIDQQYHDAYKKAVKETLNEQYGKYRYHYHPITGDVIGGGWQTRQSDDLTIPITIMEKTVEQPTQTTWTNEEKAEILILKSQAEGIFNDFISYCRGWDVPTDEFQNNAILTGGIFVCLYNRDILLNAAKDKTKKLDIDFFILKGGLSERTRLISALMQSNGFQLTSIKEYDHNTERKINSCWKSIQATDNLALLEEGKTRAVSLPYNVILSDLTTREELIKTFDMYHTQVAYQNEKLWISKNSYVAIRDMSLIPVPPLKLHDIAKERIDRLRVRGMMTKE